MKEGFKDNFSAQSAAYAKFRPRYPDALFEFLASLCATRELAWDCATGNGQCAVPLAKFFKSVIASDASEKQLGNAEPNPRVEYRLAAAENSGLTDHSIDLITVAQALHWFKIEQFWNEAYRVLRPNAVIAVWCYSFVQIAPEIDEIVNRFYGETVGPYWDFERKLVEEEYRSVSFPFNQMKAPVFAIETTWSLPHLIGYLQSWSATQKYIARNQHDPTEPVAEELAVVWGAPARERAVKWPIHLRVGRPESNIPENS